jgi:hypothetical protein
MHSLRACKAEGQFCYQTYPPSFKSYTSSTSFACAYHPPCKGYWGGAPGKAAGEGLGTQSSTADVNSNPVFRLQIGPGRNLGSCIWTAASAGEAIPLANDGQHHSFWPITTSDNAMPIAAARVPTVPSCGGRISN